MIGAAYGLTAASGWQGFFFDRHLAWVFPFTILLAAGGVNWTYEQRLRSPRTTRAPLFAVLMTAYAAVVFPAFVSALRGSAVTTASQVRFAKEAVSAVAPAGARIGVLNHPGLAYMLPDRRWVHLGGYISPRFAARSDFIAHLEVLKHEPAQRFDYWLLSEMERRHPTLRAAFGPLLIGEADVFPADIRLAVLRADFAALDAARLPCSDSARAAMEGWRLRDRLDVGYDRDEQEHDYAVNDRDPQRRIEPGLMIHMCDGRKIADIGRAVFGRESFSMNVDTGRPARLVWRAGRTLVANARYGERVYPFQKMNPGENTSWRVSVNNELVGKSGEPSVSGGDCEEVVFEIPTSAVTGETLRVATEGDAISFGWWLYQQ